MPHSNRWHQNICHPVREEPLIDICTCGTDNLSMRREWKPIVHRKLTHNWFYFTITIGWISHSVIPMPHTNVMCDSPQGDLNTLGHGDADTSFNLEVSLLQSNPISSMWQMFWCHLSEWGIMHYSYQKTHVLFLFWMAVMHIPKRYWWTYKSTILPSTSSLHTHLTSLNLLIGEFFHHLNRFSRGFAMMALRIQWQRGLSVGWLLSNRCPILLQCEVPIGKLVLS